MLTDTAIKKQIKQAVTETDPSATVILFGSRATGNAKIDSDWDIMILLNKPFVSIKDEQVFRHKLYDLELRIGIAISTFVYSLQEWGTRLLNSPLQQNIQKEGLVL